MLTKQYYADNLETNEQFENGNIERVYTTEDKELDYIDQLENEIKDLRELLKKKEMLKEHVNLVNLPTKSKKT